MFCILPLALLQFDFVFLKFPGSGGFIYGKAMRQIRDGFAVFQFGENNDFFKIIHFIS